MGQTTEHRGPQDNCLERTRVVGRLRQDEEERQPEHPPVMTDRDCRASGSGRRMSS